jgi:hypothetical protein
VDGVLFSESCSYKARIKAAEEQDKADLKALSDKKRSGALGEEDQARLAELEAKKAKADAAKKARSENDKA